MFYLKTVVITVLRYSELSKWSQASWPTDIISIAPELSTTPGSRPNVCELQLLFYFIIKQKVQ